MKVLALYYTHKRGGFCRRLYRLLSSLSTRGHDVVYLSLDQPPASLSSRVRFIRIPFPFRHRSGIFFWSIFIVWAPIFAVFTSIRERPERIIAFSPFYSSLTWLASLITRTPIVLFVRSRFQREGEKMYKNYFINRLAKLFDDIGVRAAKRLIFLTQSMKNEIAATRDLKGKDLIILPNDIVVTEKIGNSYAYQDLLSSLSGPDLPPGTLKLVSLGRFDEKKNISFLVDVFEYLRDIDVFLLVLGDGPSRSQVTTAIAQRKIKNICLPGWRENVAEILESSDLFLHPSRHEGMPNSVLEALGAGLPILVSDIPELRELAGDIRLCFSLSNPEALASRLRELAGSPDARALLNELSAAASQKYRFDWDSLAAEVVIKPI